MERCRGNFASHYGQVQVRRCVGSNCGWQGSDLSKYSQKDDGRYRSQIPEKETWSKPWERSRLISAWRGASKRLASMRHQNKTANPVTMRPRDPSTMNRLELLRLWRVHVAAWPSSTLRPKMRGQPSP